MIFGLNGDDTIDAGDGNDLVCGGNDNDTLTGNAGADFFSGGPGSDQAVDFTPSQGDTNDGTLEIFGAIIIQQDQIYLPLLAH